MFEVLIFIQLIIHYPMGMEYGQMGVDKFGEGIEWAIEFWVWVWISAGFPVPSPTATRLVHLCIDVRAFVAPCGHVCMF